MKFKAKITFEFQYNVDLKNYGTDDIQKAIALDQSYAIDNPFEFVDLVGENARTTVQIEKI